jgi:hypothetical protein
MQIPTDQPSRNDDFVVKELQSERDARALQLADVSAALTRYHFIRVLIFFVIALLVSGSDFSLPEWKARTTALKEWNDAYGRSPYITSMSYLQFDSLKNPKAERDLLTDFIKQDSNYTNRTRAQIWKMLLSI